MAEYTGRLVTYDNKTGDYPKKGRLVGFAEDMKVAVIENIDTGRLIRVPIENMRFSDGRD